MILEYFYLIDVNELFNNNKYVVYVSKQKRDKTSSSDETNNIIKDFESNVY